MYIHIDSQPAGSLQTEEDTWPPSFIFIVSRMVHMGHRKQRASLYYKTFKVLQLANIPRYLKRNILQKFVFAMLYLKGTVLFFKICKRIPFHCVPSCVGSRKTKKNNQTHCRKLVQYPRLSSTLSTEGRDWLYMIV